MSEARSNSATLQARPMLSELVFVFVAIQRRGLPTTAGAMQICNFNPMQKYVKLDTMHAMFKSNHKHVPKDQL